MRGERVGAPARTLNRRKLMGAGLAALAGVAVIVLLTGLATHRELLARSWLIMTGGLVDVDGRRLRIDCQGTGSPSVVMDAGLTFSRTTWDRVWPEVATFTRVCTYDRAGRGESDIGPKPTTSQRIADDLHKLLANAGVPAPYVLVGHSFGSLNVRLYASQHPEHVAGIVLVDGSHEDQFARFADQLPPKLRDRYVRSLVVNGEDADLEASAAQLRAAGPLPAVPSIILSARNQRWPRDWPADRLGSVSDQLQEELARRLPNATHVIAERSGHFIQRDEPQLAVQAIASVVAEVRRQRPVLAQSADASRPIALAMIVLASIALCLVGVYAWWLRASRPPRVRRRAAKLRAGDLSRRVG